MMRTRLDDVIKRLVPVVTAAALLLVSQAAFAGPWVKAPGDSYVKLSGDLFSSDRVFNLDGDLEETDYIYSHRAVRAYAEVGVHPSVALKASAPFLASTNELSEHSRYNRWGFGDLDVAAQIGLFEGSCAASIAPGARIPLYEGTVGHGDGVNAVGDDADPYTPALGDGSVDLAATAAFGCPLSSSVESWASVEAGPRFRTAGFGTSLDYAVDAGVFVVPDRLALTARAGGVQRLSTDNRRPTKSYLDTSAGFIFRLHDSFALEGGASYIPRGAFVARGFSAALGVSYSGHLF